jgi:hypothetical protein
MRSPPPDRAVLDPNSTQDRKIGARLRGKPSVEEANAAACRAGLCDLSTTLHMTNAQVAELVRSLLGGSIFPRVSVIRGGQISRVSRCTSDMTGRSHREKV